MKAFIPQLAVPPWVSVTLCIVAGFLDACTYLALFGLFVAQVTGSFVMIGTWPITGVSGTMALLAVPVFFGGGVAATITAIAAQALRQSILTTMLLLEAALLVVFIGLVGYGAPFAGPESAATLAAGMCGLAAMGVQSATVRLVFKDGASTNVMTINTTQIAIDVTQLMLAGISRHRSGGSQRADEESFAAQFFATSRARLARTLPLPLGFLAGTLAGAFAYTALGYMVLLAPTLAVAVLAMWAARRQ